MIINPTEKTLQDLGIMFYGVRNDGTYVVPGNIDLSNKGLSTLPDLSRINLEGNFLCDHNQLTNLEGAPISVAGISCTHNKLTSLAGAPKTVTWNFLCGYNQLTTLEGVPAILKGHLYCQGNNLDCLEHAPQGFTQLRSDFGVFNSWNDIPELLRVSPETRESLAREAQEAFERKVQTNTITQNPVRLLRRIGAPK